MTQTSLGFSMVAKIRAAKVILAMVLPTSMMLTPVGGKGGKETGLVKYRSQSEREDGWPGFGGISARSTRGRVDLDIGPRNGRCRLQVSRRHSSSYRRFQTNPLPPNRRFALSLVVQSAKIHHFLNHHPIHPHPFPSIPAIHLSSKSTQAVPSPEFAKFLFCPPESSRLISLINKTQKKKKKNLPSDRFL
jgi:hypothetical protein